jgi:hypothetical protein
VVHRELERISDTVPFADRDGLNTNGGLDDVDWEPCVLAVGVELGVCNVVTVIDVEFDLDIGFALGWWGRMCVDFDSVAGAVCVEMEPWLARAGDGEIATDEMLVVPLPVEGEEVAIVVWGELCLVNVGSFRGVSLAGVSPLRDCGPITPVVETAPESHLVDLLAINWEVAFFEDEAGVPAFVREGSDCEFVGAVGCVELDAVDARDIRSELDDRVVIKLEC